MQKPFHTASRYPYKLGPVIAVCVLLILLAGCGNQPEKSTLAPEDSRMVAELDSLMQTLVAQDLFSGAVLLAKDGTAIFKQAYGEANKAFGVANRTDTKFITHSMQKMFTGVAILQLVEQGKLSLDDPLAKYLPEFPNRNDAKKIKIKHLLSHTSGLGSYLNEAFYHASKSGIRTIDEMMAHANDTSLKFEPGTQWAYSQTGFLVLGKVIEEVTGDTYFNYVRENIYTPAGMINTDSYPLDRVIPNLAIGYNKEDTADEGVVFTKNTYKYMLQGSSAAGGYSTVEDLLKFDIALRSHSLVGSTSVQLLFSPKPDMQALHYGFGFDIDPDRNMVGHRGTFTGISSNFDMFLEDGYTGIVLSNYTDGRTPVIEKIRTMILDNR